MEHIAIRQLEDVSKLPGVMRAAGLPDLHVGRNPIGIAVEIEGILYPHLVGSDIGRGMGLFEMNCALKKFKQECFATKLNHIRVLEDLPTENPYPEENPIYDLGTIGGGDHFVGLQTVYGVLDGDVLKQLGISKNQLLLLTHSGLRGYGQQIFSKLSGLGGLPASSERTQAYLVKYDDVLLWAECDRRLVVKKLMGHVGYSQEVRPLLGCCHDPAKRRDDHPTHRKGTVSALRGSVVIPGPRGSLTYLALPATDTSLSGHSPSHGTGRKWARSLCKSRIRNKYERDTIRYSKLDSHAVCHDIELLHQGVLEACKNIEQVTAAFVEHGLCTVTATLRPPVTYKG